MPTTEQPPLPLGEQLAAAGQQQALANAPEWREQARTTILRLAASGERFTSEDVVARIGLPTGDAGANRNNAVGAVFAAASRRGWITRVDYVKAKRAALHAAVVAVWIGTEEGRIAHEAETVEPAP